MDGLLLILGIVAVWVVFSLLVQGKISGGC